MCSYASKLSDEQFLLWFYEQVRIRKILENNCFDIAYSGSCSEALLIYSLQDLRRIAKLLGKPLIVVSPSSDSSLYTHYRAYFEYEGLKVNSFPCIHEIVKGC